MAPRCSGGLNRRPHHPVWMQFIGKKRRRPVYRCPVCGQRLYLLRRH